MRAPIAVAICAVVTVLAAVDVSAQSRLPAVRVIATGGTVPADTLNPQKALSRTRDVDVIKRMFAEY